MRIDEQTVVVVTGAAGGIGRGRARVLIGAETFAIDLATRLAPALVNTLVGRLRGRVRFL